ncbi:MAG: TonB-dependent receptor [Litorilituus sp.]|nr:TonB-dependent receptor [Litorilituus sp.]
MKPLYMATILPITLIALSVNQAFAQAENNIKNSSENIDETIVVTATRYQQDVNKIPGAITVITESEIAKQTRVNDDLTSVLANLVPSMTPSRQKLSNQGENLRGRTALILVDGVPQNNPLRNGNRYGYPLDSSTLERIEVVNGASAVHGMGATGGLINYITLSAKKGDNFKQKLGLRINDSFNSDSTSTKMWYNLRHYDEKFDIVGAASWYDQGLYYDAKDNAIGMNSIQGETQDSSATNFFIKTGINFADQRLEFSTNHYELENKNHYVPIKGDFNKGIVGTVAKGTNPGEAISNKVESYNLKYSHDDVANGGLTVQFFYQQFDAIYGQAYWLPTPSVIRDQGTITSTKKGMKLSYNQIELLGLDDSWVFGLDVLKDSTQQYLLGTGLAVTPVMSYSGISPFVQGDILISEDLRLTGGLRHESTTVDVNNAQTLYSFGLYNEEGNPHGRVNTIGGEQDFSELVYNLGAVYRLSDEANVFIGFNQGFGLPDIGRVLRGNWIGDKGQAVDSNINIDFNTMPAVKPVVTDNFEIGVNYTNDQWQLAASAYYSLAKDGANLSLNDGGSYDVVRQRTEITGAEVSAKYQWNEQLSLAALYSTVNGEVDSNANGEVDSDMDLKNVSPDRLMLSVNYDLTDNLSSAIQLNTLFDTENKAKNQKFSGYSLVDASMGFGLQEYGKLTFAIENLLNKNYVGYFSQIRNHSSYYFAGRGRNYSINYEVNF